MFLDGKTLNYGDFVSLMKEQKAVMEKVQVTVTHIVVDGDKIATSHTVNGVKRDGSEIEAEIIAIFQVRDGKLVLCDALTRLANGSREDRDLGSRK